MKFIKPTTFRKSMRVLLYGPSGSGKTYSALLIAKTLAKKLSMASVAVIDSEKGRSALKFRLEAFKDFDCDLGVLPDNPTPDDYCIALEETRKYSIVVVDGLSQEWDYVVKEADSLKKSTKNAIQAWGKAKNQGHAKVLEAIANHPAHLICTARERIEMTNNQVCRTPKVDRSLFYALDFIFRLDANHIAHLDREDGCALGQSKISEAWASRLYDSFYNVPPSEESKKRAFIKRIKELAASLPDDDPRKKSDDELAAMGLEDLVILGKSLVDLRAESATD